MSSVALTARQPGLLPVAEGREMRVSSLSSPVAPEACKARSVQFHTLPNVSKGRRVLHTRRSSDVKAGRHMRDCMGGGGWDTDH